MKGIYITVLLILGLNNANAQIITTVAGNGTQGYNGNGGQATSSELNSPGGVALDLARNLYIADVNNFVIRKVNTTGIISVFAGGGSFSGLGDGGPATLGSLSGAASVAIDLQGNVYIADGGDDRIRIVNTNGIINTIVGTTNGYTGDGGQASLAELNNPIDMAIDVLGNLYINDYGNNVIRKVNTSGIITTIVGNGTTGYSGDGGQATSAQIHDPAEIAIDAIGNLYFTDTYNAVVRKVNTAGIITTIAGTALAYGYSGDGGAATLAKFNEVDGIAIDSIGNIYISDFTSSVVRKVNTSGIITTIVGTGTSGYSGDGGVASLAELKNPGSLTLDVIGNLYISDPTNYRIRKVTNAAQAGIEQFVSSNEQVTVYPNPAKDVLNVVLSHLDKLNTQDDNATITITDMLGNTIYYSTFNTQHNTVPVAEFTSGVYIIEVRNSKGAAFKKFIKE